MYDRANYGESMSVFGRAVRDALKGQCIEDIKLSRVLAVHLYNFIRRECTPFEHPRMSVAQEEAEAEEGRAAGNGGRQDAAARKKREAAERKAKKEAEKAEAKRRAKLGAKAAAEELRKAKEAALLRGIEEEKRRRTQACRSSLGRKPPVSEGSTVAAESSLMVNGDVCRGLERPRAGNKIS